MQKKVRSRKVERRLAITFFLFTIVLCFFQPAEFINTAAEQETQEDTYQFTLPAHRLSNDWEFWVYSEGTITVTISWTGPNKLRLFLYGPERDDPYVEVIRESPLVETFTITPQILAAGQRHWKWRARLGNASNTAAEGSISISYPKNLPRIDSFQANAQSGDDLPLLQGLGTPMYAAFPTQQFTLSWRVDSVVTSLSLESGCGAVAPELRSGVAMDCPNASMRLSTTRGSKPEMISELGQVYTLRASNRHGDTEATIIILPKVWVGYFQATCIGCAPCQDCGKTPQVERLADSLRDVEQRVSGGCIRNNVGLDRFDDPYLRGNLSDDILQTMKTVTLYTSDEHIPNVTPGTICEGSVGYTSGDPKYILMCLSRGADGLTLLHELEHVVDPNTDECRAPWVAQYCYDIAVPSCP